MNKKISRREMLKTLGLVTAGFALASCGGTPPAQQEAPAASGGEAAAEPTAAGAPAAAGGEVQLEVKSVQPEYSAQSRQIWDVYQEQNPNVKITLVDVNEDTQAAYDARIAAGNPAREIRPVDR